MLEAVSRLFLRVHMEVQINLSQQVPQLMWLFSDQLGLLVDSHVGVAKCMHRETVLAWSRHLGVKQANVMAKARDPLTHVAGLKAKLGFHHSVCVSDSPGEEDPLQSQKIEATSSCLSWLCQSERSRKGRITTRVRREKSVVFEMTCSAQPTVDFVFSCLSTQPSCPGLSLQQIPNYMAQTQTRKKLQTSAHRKQICKHTHDQEDLMQPPQHPTFILYSREFDSQLTLTNATEAT